MSAPSRNDPPHGGTKIRRRGRARPRRHRVRTRIATALADGGRFLYRRLPVSPALRWRLTRIVFALAGPLLRSTPVWRTYQREFAWRERHVHSKSPGARPSELPGWRPAAANPGFPDLIFWGVIDWEFRIQRPQHLARALARRGHRILYVSPLFIDSRQPGFDIEQIDPELPIYSLRLCADQRPILHEEPIRAPVVAQLRDGIARCLLWATVRNATSILHHPAWLPVARTIPDVRLVYDWIDDHAAFPRAGEHVASLQESLLGRADLVVSSAERLDARARSASRTTARIPNAVDFEHFATACEAEPSDDRLAPTIGYYGALADWMDVGLLRAVAERYTGCTLLLIGEDTARVEWQLRDLDNVVNMPEVAYAALPLLLAGMRVCLIPFEASQLTASTNPVKVYEYLAVGKPVVATNLPELRDPEIDALVYRSTDLEDFVANVGRALEEPDDDPRRDARRRFAARNTWDTRGAAFAEALARIPEPLVSVVIVTYENLAFTRACVESIRRDTSYGNLELIFVDNGSKDGTTAYLNALAAEAADTRVILCDENAGFAAAVNRGLDQALGDYLVLLNNDTVVSEGWLRGLVGHMTAAPEIGLLGPVSNGVDNAARLFTHYAHPSAMTDEIFTHTRTHMGDVFDVDALSFFCVMIPRRVYEIVGDLDARYGIGYFEDDDYCRRVAATGLRICCANDVYVHHEQSATFDKLGARARRELFERNRATFESSWGEWQPHEPGRSSPAVAPRADAPDPVSDPDRSA